MAPVLAATHSKPGLTAIGFIGTAFATICFLVVGILKLSPILWGTNIEPLSLRSNHQYKADHLNPVRCSSHNDYWRETPLHSALQAGCISVEADVWAFQDELYISHNRDRLAPHRTLSTLYIDPLVKILEEKNIARGSGAPAQNDGVFDIDPIQTFVLLVDIKANPTAAWPLLLRNAEPLQSRGWLSHFQNESFIIRPITIVASGKTRIQDVEENPLRNIFLDAPLAKLDGNIYNESNSYYASVSFQKSIGWVWPAGLRQSQLVRIRDQITKAHSLGLKVRYWSLPVWPLQLRNQLWSLLVTEGLDVLHVDDFLVAKEILTKR